MTVTINGTTGVAGVDGTAATPAIQGNDTNTGIFFPAADTIAFAEGGVEAMRIDSSGNVGIGTSSPAYTLDVVQKTSDDSYAFQLRGYTTGSDGTRTVNMRTVSSNNGDWANFRMDASSFIWRHQGATERMRIDSTGNVLFGTTSTNTGNGCVFFRSNGTGTYWINATSTGSSWEHWAFRIGTTQVGAITTSGSNTSYVTSSDYRLKEKIAPMTGALATVQALKPCTYTWKADGSDGQGFIAHELAEVVPDAVTGQKDAVDEDGNPKYQGVDTSFLVATLTAAIQEQQAIITDLKSRIEALEQA